MKSKEHTRQITLWGATVDHTGHSPHTSPSPPGIPEQDPGPRHSSHSLRMRPQDTRTPRQPPGHTHTEKLS
ncbi:hypothetical protein ATANTOWER_021299 [Ataeniobius toweri]|uniref:Uncharacterized protein n=1 Tax=Ataeniobius toweri TaxID=208326 RepID=A0ABU7CIW0_9TELE|nr:hypothetical protein [Ataeniobius toweri]